MIHNKSARAMIAALAVASTLAWPAGTIVPADPYIWLEEVNGDKALEFVRAANAKSQGELEARPGYAKLYDRLLSIYNSKERIPYVMQRGDLLYNFWRDDKNIRGIWRRTTWDEYRKPTPTWETVLDLDKLAAAEKENWVWHGSACLYPKYERCLVSLSRGGGDADVTREFDMTAQAFVKDGFELPEAKSRTAWIDEDTLLVATDFGVGSMTQSGYPRIVKEWKRGTPLTAAKTVFEGQAADVSVSAAKDFTPGFERQFITRAMTFWTNEVFERVGDKLVKIDMPDDARATAVRDQMFLQLRTPWTSGAKTYPAGALLAADYDGYLKGGRDFQMLFEPTERMSLGAWTATRSQVYLIALDNVKSRAFEYKREYERRDGLWQKREVALPGIGSAGMSPIDPYRSDDYFLTFTNYLTPASLYLTQARAGRPEKLKTMPSFFDAAGMAVEQFEAISKDGTRIPYFVVSRQKLERDGSHPTLLYGYGGFEVPMTPGYSGSVGAGWLETGGVFVVANIRGGGEFGPKWHQAALKANRQRAFDDFIAVAEDLIARKITSPKHLAIEGGSNGGLLVGAVLVQRPELFKAVVCQVPLLDMRRYHTLLAGASWVGEYGNPDAPDEWSFISKYSPYQNVVKNKKYPRVFFLTSTRDDRVHPGHARKMYAKMKDFGHDVLYFENTEGGHAGAANNQQQAKMWALTYTFLQNELK